MIEGRFKGRRIRWRVGRNRCCGIGACNYYSLRGRNSHGGDIITSRLVLEIGKSRKIN
jgi:hypothetical protein